MTLRRQSLLAGHLALAVFLLTPACASKQAPPSPLEVLVVPVVQREVSVVREWIGTLDGSVNADIRPKVEGYLLKQFYKEGQFVRRNAPLFEIDPRQFRAALEQAQGTLARAEARLAKARKTSSASRPSPRRRPSVSRSSTTRSPPSARRVAKWQRPERPSDRPPSTWTGRG